MFYPNSIFSYWNTCPWLVALFLTNSTLRIFVEQKVAIFWGFPFIAFNSFPTPVCKSFGCDNAKERSIIKDDDKWNGDLFLLAKCGILALATLVNYFYELGMYHLGVHKMRFVQNLIWWNCHRFLLTSRIYYSKRQDHDTPLKQI